MALQEQTSAVYAYYDIPIVSVRDGLMPSFRSGELSPLDWMMWGDFGFHPQPAMQAYVASSLLEALRRAAVLTSAEERTAVSTATVGEAGGRSEDSMPVPLHPGLQLRHPLACYVWGLDYKHNWKHFGFRLLAPPPTLLSEGWTNSLEQRHAKAGMLRTNPGLVANVSGAQLVAVLDTRRHSVEHLERLERRRSPLGGGSRGAEGDHVIVQLEYLTSHAGGMGVLYVTCTHGCSCPPDITFDAHTPSIKASRHTLGCFPVTQAAQCHVRLAVAQRTASKGHKFVLHAMRVLAQRGAQGGHGRADEEQGLGGGARSWACDASLPHETHTYGVGAPGVGGR